MRVFCQWSILVLRTLLRSGKITRDKNWAKSRPRVISVHPLPSPPREEVIHALPSGTGLFSQY